MRVCGNLDIARVKSDASGCVLVAFGFAAALEKKRIMVPLTLNTIVILIITALRSPCDV